ncbi:putative autophagy protein APG9 [Neospora caninum Liverpool]|uniref:Autophagy-related protein 9 n=1 Tax=Neospora caninum (strain Liverpool) TaxID=572307 RepID=F0VGK9_NEOCL|nr:putative autophagy protein APG9 [Neospora caninum Liverpool]CBZ52853.1 putative autophagy protein APG9 [Neospora caninum Liverpool]|eukprot:XP_003882885.1 putative autophagy protein APG9 [Neospora caninum Liverpool]
MAHPHTRVAADGFFAPPPQSERYPGRSAVFAAYASGSSFSYAAPGNRFFSLVTAPLRLLVKLQQGAFRRLSLTLPPAPSGFSPFLPPLLGDASQRREEERDLEAPSASPSDSSCSSSCLRYHSGAAYGPSASGLARSRRGTAFHLRAEKETCFASAETSVRANEAEKELQTSSPRTAPASAPGSCSWDAVADLDKFLFGVYRYWMDGGLFAILSAHLAHLTALAFTIYFSWFLILFVNWKDIVSCTTEEQCRSVPLLIASPFHPWGYKQTLCTVYVVSLSAFLLFNIVVSYLNCRDALLLRTYFRERLFIPSDAALQLLDWPEVTALLLKAQEAVPFCIVTNELSALDIASTIMREENYFIALTNKNILTQKLPSWVPPKLLYTQVMQWNIRRAIFSRLFDERQRIYRNLFTSPPRDELSPYRSAAAATLASRFKLLSILNLLFLVPLFLFIFFFFFLKHAEDFRLNRQSIVRREFNGYAYWMFREFNELPHQINHRLTLAAAAADDYLQLSPISPSVLHIRLLVKYLVGSLLSIFILLYLFDETPLLFIRIFDRNLLWYTIILGVLYAGIRDTGPSARQDSAAGGGRGGTGFAASDAVCSSPGCRGLNSPLALYERCMRVVEYTHHLPACWRAPAGVFAVPPSSSAASADSQLSARTRRIAPHAPLLRASLSADIAAPPLTGLPSSLSLLPPVPRSAWFPDQEPTGLFPSSGAFGAEGEERQRVTGVSVQHKLVMHAFCSSFYGLRITCLLEELLAVLATPLMLWWFMPAICDDICAFIFAVTSPSSFGDVCCFSSLDLERFGTSCYLPHHEPACACGRASREKKRQTLANAARREKDRRVGAETEALDADDGEPWEARRVYGKDEETGGKKSRGGGRDSSRVTVHENAREEDQREERGGRRVSLGAVARSSGLALDRTGGDDEDQDERLGDGKLGPRGSRFPPLHANSGKVEKSALTFVLTYRIPPPYDDTSPLWTVFASDSLANSIVGASQGPAVRFVLRLERFQREQIKKFPYLSHELAAELLVPLSAFPAGVEGGGRAARENARSRRRRRAVKASSREGDGTARFLRRSREAARAREEARKGNRQGRDGKGRGRKGREREERERRGEEVKRPHCGGVNTVVWRGEASARGLPCSSKKRRREDEEAAEKGKLHAANSEDESVVAGGGTGEGALWKTHERGFSGGTGEEAGTSFGFEGEETARRTHAHTPSSVTNASHASRCRLERDKGTTGAARRKREGNRLQTTSSASPSTEDSSPDSSPDSWSDSASDASSDAFSDACSSPTSVTHFDVCGPPPIPFERQAPYFFWLERLYEQKSGRVLFATNQLNFFTRRLFRQFPAGCQEEASRLQRRRKAHRKRRQPAETHPSPSVHAQGDWADSSAHETEEEKEAEEERDEGEEAERDEGEGSERDEGESEVGERVIFDQSREIGNASFS